MFYDAVIRGQLMNKHYSIAWHFRELQTMYSNIFAAASFQYRLNEFKIKNLFKLSFCFFVKLMKEKQVNIFSSVLTI